MAKKVNRRMPACDPVEVAEFDYSSLSADFAGLGKPVQRALIKAGLNTPVKLARKTRQEFLSLHGVGKTSLPKIEAILKKKSLKFKAG